MSTNYTYSLYWLDNQGNLQPGAGYALSDSAIRGIYSAQLLLLVDDKLSIMLNSPLLSFKFVLVNQAGAQHTSLTRETAYNTLLYDLTKYVWIGRGNRINIFGSVGLARERIYHIVDINSDLSMANQSDNDSFSYLITSYDISRGGVGVKVVASSPTDFLEGFLAYFRWIVQYNGYKTQMPSFNVISYLNGIRTGAPTLNTTIYPFILDQLPTEIHEMIVSYLPGFRYVSKYYYELLQRELPCWKMVPWDRVEKEFEIRARGPALGLRHLKIQVRDIRKIRSSQDIISILPKDSSDWKNVERLLDIVIGRQTEVLLYILNNVKDKQKYVDYTLSKLFEKSRLAVFTETEEAKEHIRQQILAVINIPEIDVSKYRDNIFSTFGYDTLIDLFKSNKITLTNINIESLTDAALTSLVDYPDYDISPYSDRIVKRMTDEGSLYVGLLGRKGVDLSIDDNRLLRRALNADNVEIVTLLLNSSNVDVLKSPDLASDLMKRGYNIIQNIMNNKKLADTKSIQSIIYDVTDPVTFEILLAANPTLDISSVTPQIIAATMVDTRLLDLLLNNPTFDSNVNNGSLVSLLVTYNQIDSLRKVLNDPRTVLSESNKRSIRLKPELADIRI